MNELSMMQVEGTDFIGELTSRTTMFCSMTANTEKEKASLFNAMNNPEFRLADEINKTILAKDLYCEVVTLEKKDADQNPVLDAYGNPVINSCPRVVIIDDKGIGHQCVSVGIYSAMRKIIAIYGPPTWEKPIPLIVKQTTKGVRKMLTIDVKA